MGAVAKEPKQGTAMGGLYSIMQTMESKLGGGEGVEGIYGSITLTGMQKIFDVMHHSCGLDGRSRLVDIGAGLGRPLLHAAVQYGLAGAYGVELDPVKCSKAEAFIRHVTREMKARGLAPASGMATPLVTRAPVERVASLDPSTHAYSFWEGVPRDGKAAFGRLFRTSATLKSVAVVQRAMRGIDPCLEMRQLGFGPLLLIKSFSVNMSGSGRSFTAYIFSKIPAPSADLLRRQSRLSDVSAGGASPPPIRPSSAAEGATAARSAARLIRLRTEETEAADVIEGGGTRAWSQAAPFADAGARGSPAGKRGLAAGAAAAGGEGAVGEGAGDEGSPSKKTRDGDQELDQGGSPGAAQSVASHSYGLRPKRLDLSRSLSSSVSSGGAAAAGGSGSGRSSGRAALRRAASDSSRGSGGRGAAAAAAAAPRAARGRAAAAAAAAAVAAVPETQETPDAESPVVAAVAPAKTAAPTAAAAAAEAPAAAAAAGAPVVHRDLSSMFRQQRKGARGAAKKADAAAADAAPSAARPPMGLGGLAAAQAAN